VSRCMLDCRAYHIIANNSIKMHHHIFAIYLIWIWIYIYWGSDVGVPEKDDRVCCGEAGGLDLRHAAWRGKL
jgi:hypothetical protein